MIRPQPERNQVMVSRHIRDNLYSIERMDYDGVALFSFYPAPVHLCARPDDSGHMRREYAPKRLSWWERVTAWWRN